MSPSELIAAGERLHGQHWRQPLAEQLGVNIATLRRWTAADIAIPKPVALAIRLLLKVPKGDRQCHLMDQSH